MVRNFDEGNDHCASRTTSFINRSSIAEGRIYWSGEGQAWGRHASGTKIALQNYDSTYGTQVTFFF
jgi:hypothetical protein